jgi:hypothetical protein
MSSENPVVPHCIIHQEACAAKYFRLDERSCKQKRVLYPAERREAM